MIVPYEKFEDVYILMAKKILKREISMARFVLEVLNNPLVSMWFHQGNCYIAGSIHIFPTDREFIKDKVNYLNIKEQYQLIVDTLSFIKPLEEEFKEAISPEMFSEIISRGDYFKFDRTGLYCVGAFSNVNLEDVIYDNFAQDMEIIYKQNEITPEELKTKDYYEDLMDIFWGPGYYFSDDSDSEADLDGLNAVWGDFINTLKIED